MKKTGYIRSILRRLKIGWKKYYAVLFLLLLFAALFYAAKIEPNLVHVVRYEVALPPDAAPELDGFTIAFLSDFHLNERTRAMLPEIIGKTNALMPDVILLGGDYFVNNLTGGMECCFEENFSQFSAPGGVYAVLGNHDWQIADLIRKTAKSGNVTLLESESVTVPGARGGAINLLGIDDYNHKGITDSEVLRAKLDKTIPNVVVAHEPEFAKYLPSGVTLFLAGHTHGGQINLPFFGSLLRSARTSQKMMNGISKYKDMTVIVTAGIGNGNGFPMRFCTMPEIVCIKLIKKK